MAQLNIDYEAASEEFEITFNQPMDRASVEAGFFLEQSRGANQ